MIIGLVVLFAFIGFVAAAMIALYYWRRLRQARAKTRAAKARGRAMKRISAIKAASRLGGAKCLSAAAIGPPIVGALGSTNTATRAPCAGPMNVQPHNALGKMGFEPREKGTAASCLPALSDAMNSAADKLELMGNLSQPRAVLPPLGAPIAAPTAIEGVPIADAEVQGPSKLEKVYQDNANNAWEEFQRRRGQRKKPFPLAPARVRPSMITEEEEEEERKKESRALQ